MKNISIFNTKTLLLIFILTFLNSCGKDIIRSAPSREIPVNEGERVQKNIREGRAFKLFDLSRNKGGDFQFASANPLWRDSLEVLDFMPIINASYSGGIIITDWYDENKSKNSIKITVKFLSNEIRPDGLEILVYKKNCKSFESCQSIKDVGKLNTELKLAILKKAAQIKKIDLAKKKK